MLIYYIIGLLWGVFAYEIHVRTYPDSGEAKSYLSFYANVLLWPIGLPLGIYKLTKEKNDG
jgi:hypothetical protein